MSFLNPFKCKSSHSHDLEAEGTKRPRISLGEAAQGSGVGSNITGRSKHGAVTILSQTPSGRKAVADIVLVHGLRGDQTETWLHKESGVFWPLHLLPKEEYIRDARIATFGSGSEVVKAWLGGHPSSNQLEDMCRRILHQLWPEDKSDAIQMLLLTACAPGRLRVEDFRRVFQLSKDSPVTLKKRLREKKLETRALDLKKTDTGKSSDSIMLSLLDVDPVETSIAWSFFFFLTTSLLF